MPQPSSFRLALSRLALLALLSLSFITPARAEVTIKLATLAPEGTSWYKATRNLADRWDKASGGEVKVKIYAGGVAGNETAMVRKMRIGQLHAGAITTLGMADIEPSAIVMQSPLLIRSYEELDYLMEQMAPVFEARMKDKGFIVLNWGDAGWIHLFSNAPMLQPADAAKFKIFAFEGDPDAVKIYKGAGFNPVVMASTDVMPSLQSGLINAFPATPLAALSLQWFAMGKNMLDLPWAPLLGATVISESAWNAIPERYHAEFLAIAQEEGKAIQSEIRRQDSKAIEVMKKYGLTVNSIDAKTKAAWQAICESTWPIVRGQIVPEEVFDATIKAIEEFRAK